MNIRRCWLSLGLGVRIDNGLRRAIWRSLHSRRCLTLWAFSRRSPSFGVQRPGGSLRLLFPLVFRRNRRPGAVRRRWCWFVDLPSLRRHHLCTGRHEGIATYQTLLRKSLRKLLRFGYLGVGDHTIIVQVSRLELFSAFSPDRCGALLCKGRNGGQQYGCQDGCAHGVSLWLEGLPPLSAPHRIWFRSIGDYWAVSGSKIFTGYLR
jgi:hypothetical protein